MMKKIARLSACLLFAIAVLGFNISASAVVVSDPYMQTDSFSSYIEVYDDNTYRINEIIDVNFLTYRHGIYRYIPCEFNYYREIDGQEVVSKAVIRVTDVDVSIYDFECYKEDGNFVIQIGDPDINVFGNRKYKISYTVKCADDGIAEFDDFYWNALPHEWQTDISSADVTVEFKKDADLSDYTFLSGSYGSVSNDKFEVIVEGNKISAHSLEPLEFGEGATLRVQLPDDYFLKQEPNPWLIGMIVAVAVIALAVVIVLKNKFGKKQQIIPVVNFYPPEEMTSADIGYVLDGITDTKDIISLIIYWADKGYLSITELDEETIRLTKLKSLDDSAKSYERTLFYELFASGDSVTTAELKDNFYQSINAAKLDVRWWHTESGRDIFKKGSAIAGIFASVIAALPLAALLFIGYHAKIVSDNILLSLALGGVVSVLCLVALTVVNYKKNVISRTKFIVLKILAWVLFALAAVLQFAMGVFVLEFPMLSLVSLASQIASAVLATDMRTLTERGRKLTGEILGFKEFIKTAELERLEAMVNENPQYFYRVLPFAYVMGLSDEWSKKFETIATQSPSWYNGHTYSRFNTYLFMRSFSRSINTIETNMVSVPRSKGGGGFAGGGFSGGGGGGGGGGSW